MSECNHDCSSCSSAGNCESKSFIEKPNKLSRIGKVIGIVSGKGGVGKTLVSSMLAVNMKRLPNIFKPKYAPYVRHKPVFCADRPPPSQCR